MLSAGTAITVLTICMPSGNDGLSGGAGREVNWGKRAPGDVAVLLVDGGGARRRGKDLRIRCWSDWRWKYRAVATKYSIFDLDAFSHRQAEKASEKDHCALRGPERLHTCGYDDMTIVVFAGTVQYLMQEGANTVIDSHV